MIPFIPHSGTLAQFDYHDYIHNLNQIVTQSQAATHFYYRDWIPTVRQMIRGGMIGGVVFFFGVLFYFPLRKIIRRAKLSFAYALALFSFIIYFVIGGALPQRMLDHSDTATIWIDRAILAALLLALLRVIDRLIIVPVMSHAGKVPVHRFFHQIVTILIFAFAILGYGALEFDWDIDKFLAGSAVISIVLGLALQETLGNFFSGLVMQASSPFALGDWIICAGVEGRVADMTWRAVTLHTTEDNFVIIPNGTIAKELITNFHTPTPATALTITVGLEYSLPPDDAIAVLKTAALESHGVLSQPEPVVYLQEFADSSIVYHLKFWISEPRIHRKIEHLVRTNVWYRLRQNNYNIPFPIRTVEHISQQKKSERDNQSAAALRRQAIADLWLFAPLTDDEKNALADRATDILLTPGQTLFHQNDPGESLFVIRQGEVEVLASHNRGPQAKVATLKPGDFFGEMSALTGQPRSATIRASTPLACVEINKQDLQSIFTADPAMMEKMSTVIAGRNAHRLNVSQTHARTAAAEEESAASAAAAEQKTLFARMRKFFTGSDTPDKP